MNIYSEKYSYYKKTNNRYKSHKYFSKMIGGNTMLNKKLTTDDFKMDDIQSFKTVEMDIGKKTIEGTDISYIEADPNINVNTLRRAISMPSVSKKIYEDILGEKNVIPIKIWLTNENEDTYDIVSEKNMIEKLRYNDHYKVIIMMILATRRDKNFVTEIYKLHAQSEQLFTNLFEYEHILSKYPDQQMSDTEIKKFRELFNNKKEFIDPSHQNYQNVIAFIELYERIYSEIFFDHNIGRKKGNIQKSTPILAGGNPPLPPSVFMAPHSFPHSYVDQFKSISGQQVNFNIFGADNCNDRMKLMPVGLMIPPYIPYSSGMLPDYDYKIPADKSDEDAIKEEYEEYLYNKYNRIYGAYIFRNYDKNKIHLSMLKDAISCVNFLMSILDLYDTYYINLMHYNYEIVSIYDNFFILNDLTKIINMNKQSVADKIRNNHGTVLLQILLFYDNPVHKELNMVGHANIVICNHETCLRIEPHRKSYMYCRNSVRNEIRKYLPDDWKYIDNILLTEYTGLQNDELLSESEKKVFGEEITKIHNQLLNGTSGYCASWCILAFFIIMMNIRLGLLEISKYLTTFGLEFKSIKEIPDLLFSKIQFGPEKYIANSERIKINDNIYLSPTDYFFNQYYPIVKNSMLYNTVLIACSKIKELKIIEDLPSFDEKYLKKYEDISSTIKENVFDTFYDYGNIFIDVHEEIDKEYKPEMCDVNFYKTNPISLSIKQEYVDDMFNPELKQRLNELYNDMIDNMIENATKSKKPLDDLTEEDEDMDNSDKTQSADKLIKTLKEALSKSSQFDRKSNI